MKGVFILTLMFALIAATAIGCLMIFDVYTLEQGADILLRVLAVIFLLGASSAVIALFVRHKKTPAE